MSEIDWSKAPEGATHFDTAAYRTKSFMKLENGAWYFWPPMSRAPEWSYWGADSVDADTDPFVPRPATAGWNGEGLPPVGTVCEVRGCMSHYQQWNKVTIFAVRGKTVMFDMDDGRWGQTDSHEFRPLRTPEQIAAEERETELNRMVATVSMLDKSWARKVCAGLYDAGYRKFEIIDEPKS